MAWSTLLFVAFFGMLSFAYNNGLGERPPMGWNTWCTDDICGILDKCTDAEVRRQARAVVESGMKDVGYEFINMDDCWNSKTRDSEGNLQPDANRFPFGMKALADYVHSLGLKIGLYTCIGTKTCKHGLPGSFGHYEQDAKQFANWGIDFVKCDNCAKPPEFSEQTLYKNFSQHLNATGRPILFSLCEWGDADVQTWGASVAQMYRIQQDHLPFWWFPGLASGKGFGQGVINIIDYIATLKPSTFVKPFGWMDPDFLMTLFRPTMTFHYSKVEFTMWSMWSAPLIMATNAHNMTDEKRRIVLNKEVIALDQDALAVAADQVWANKSSGARIWTKPLSNGDVAIAFLNSDFSYLTHSGMTISSSWSGLGLSNVTIVSVRDLWKHEEVPSTSVNNQSISVWVDPNDVVAVRVSCSPRCHHHPGHA